MKKAPKADKSKMKAISLDDEADILLLQAGDGSRTGGIRELLELYLIVSNLEGSSYKEKKYKLIAMVQGFKKSA